MRSMAEAANPVFDMLATIAVDQGADPDEIACACDERQGAPTSYLLAVGENVQVLGSLVLEEGNWPALLASGMAANANGLPRGTDLAAYAYRYDGAQVNA